MKEQPSKEVVMKIAAFFLRTSVPRILAEMEAEEKKLKEGKSC